MQQAGHGGVLRELRAQCPSSPANVASSSNPKSLRNSSSLSSYAKLLYPHNDVRSEVELELGWVELRCFARWIPVAPPGDVCDCGFGDFGELDLVEVG